MLFFGLLNKYWSFRVFCDAWTLSLPYALTFISGHYIHQTVCFIQRLPKMSSVAPFGHYVWLKCMSDKEKSLFCNSGALCLSWASFVNEKLVWRGLAISQWFLGSFTIWWIKIYIKRFQLGIGLLIGVFWKFPSFCQSVAKPLIKLLYQPIHRNTMRTRGPSFGLIFPPIRNDVIKYTKLVHSVVRIFVLKILETKN